MSTRATGGYSIAGREDALDFMARYPGYGEQRWYTSAIGVAGFNRTASNPAPHSSSY